jgi:hypothetical protein
LINQVATFLRLVDEEGRLSVTNVAVLIALVKLAIAPQASLVDCGTVLVTLVGYNFKKTLAQPTVAPDA